MVLDRTTEGKVRLWYLTKERWDYDTWQNYRRKGEIMILDRTTERKVRLWYLTELQKERWHFDTWQNYRRKGGIVVPDSRKGPAMGEANKCGTWRRKESTRTKNVPIRPSVLISVTENPWRVANTSWTIQFDVIAVFVWEYSSRWV